jgi:hypothetical protein
MNSWQRRWLLNWVRNMVGLLMPIHPLMQCKWTLILVATLPCLEAACSIQTVKREELLPSLRNGPGISTTLVPLLVRIEKGDIKAWVVFAAFLDDPSIDGERSLTYSRACAELVRRDPTFLLRRHLLGDPAAVRVAKRAYGYIGMNGRHALNWIHASRLQLARTEQERQRIEEYIIEVQAVLASIDRKYW